MKHSSILLLLCFTFFYHSSTTPLVIVGQLAYYEGTEEEWVWWSPEAEYAAEEALEWNTEELEDDGWVDVDLDVAKSDPQIQQAQDFGIQAVLQKGVTEGTITDTNYSLKQVNSVFKQVVSGLNYRFDIILTNSVEELSAIFVVYSRPWANLFELLSHELDVAGTL